jgi:pimeloyl-ACP methyl ester carboxylesterase
LSGQGAQGAAPREAASARGPSGPGSVFGAPHLPAAFANTFASRYVVVDGLRLHAVIGGKGRPLLLVHGWPQTWYQWRLVMLALARDFEVIAVDQRGIGLSDKPEGGYDAGSQANDMVELMEALGHRRFAMVGFDTGMPIGYALAADHPERLERLVVGEAVITGVTPSSPLLVPGPLNKRLWHIAGGGKGLGEGVANTMKIVADNVESHIIPDCGHWLAEEAPEQLLAALTPFLAPYRGAATQ